MKYRGILLGAALPIVLTGCVTYDWRHVHITDPAQAELQHKIDSGACSGMAAASAPIPQYQYQPQPQPSTIVGSSTTYSPYGQSRTQFQGSVIPQQDPKANIAAMAQLGATIRASQTQNSLFSSCMYERGWANGPQELELLQARQQSNEAELQAIIDGIPDLARWQKTDQFRWDKAVLVNADLLTMEPYKFYSHRDRIALATQIVAQMFPEGQPVPE